MVKATHTSAKSISVNNPDNIDNKGSNRNKVRQVIAMKDGTSKAVFHDKKFHAPQYVDRKNYWNLGNTVPKPKSKRQQKLNPTITVAGNIAA